MASTLSKIALAGFVFSVPASLAHAARETGVSPDRPGMTAKGMTPDNPVPQSAAPDSPADAAAPIRKIIVYKMENDIGDKVTYNCYVTIKDKDIRQDDLYDRFIEHKSGLQEILSRRNKLIAFQFVTSQATNFVAYSPAGVEQKTCRGIAPTICKRTKKAAISRPRAEEISQIVGRECGEVVQQYRKKPETPDPAAPQSGIAPPSP